MTGDVDGRQQVLGHQALGHDDTVLVVEAFPRHVGHSEVLTQCELAVIGRGAVGQRLTLLNGVADAHERAVVDAGGLVGALVLGQVILVHAAGMLDDNLGGVGKDDLAGVLGQGDLARVQGGATLHAGTDIGSGGVNQRHGLTLHVGAHERTLSVVVLEERDQRGCDGEHLARRDVHVVDVLDRHVGGSAEGAVEVAGTGDHGMRTDDLALGIGRDELVGLGIERRVGRRDNVLLFLVSGHPVDLVGGNAVLDAAERGLDEAILVDAGVEGKRADQADVGAFGGLDRAHTAVVRVVNVADGRRHVGAAAGARLVAGKTARAECGQTALVGQTGQRVRLVHELRELRGTEELLDGGHDRADVDERLRGNLVDVLGAHALTDDALHTAHADTELVGDELADGADTAVAKVVDVVNLEALLAGSEGQKVAQRSDDILVGEHRDLFLGGEVELLVDLVATDAGQVVALRVEEQALEQAAGSIHGGRLARAQATVDLDEGVLASEGGIALEGALDHIGVAEQLDDVVVGDGDAKGAQEHRGALLALTVDGDHELIALVDLKLEPGTAGRDNLGLVDLLARIHLGAVVHARGTNELGDNDSLGTVDDEGALIGHHGEVAHEDELLLDLAGLLVGETDVGQKRSLIGHILLAALLDGVRGVAELMLAEGNLENMVLALDGAGFLERLTKALVLKTLKGFPLNRDKVGELHGLRDFPEADALALSGSVCVGHQVFPPSRKCSVGWRGIASPVIAT